MPFDASRIMSGYGFCSQTAEGPQILEAIAPDSALVELARRQGAPEQAMLVVEPCDGVPHAVRN